MNADQYAERLGEHDRQLQRALHENAQLRADVLALKQDLATMNENYDSLQVQHVALKQERDNAVFLLSHRDEVAEALLTSARESERRLRERVTNTLQHFREVTAAARRNREPKTGMQVPYHGEFASAVPSVIRDLEWFVRAFDRALTDDPPGQNNE